MKAAALAVGINQYKYSPGSILRGCVPDLSSMARFFYGLGVRTKEIKTLQDSGAVKAAIMERWASMASRGRAGDLDHIFIAHSSHGSTMPCATEFDGLDEVLCCYDTRAGDDGEWDRNTVIRDNEIHDLFADLPPEVRVEIWLDTCYSGGMLKHRDGSAKPKFLPPPTPSTEGPASFTHRILARPLDYQGLVLWAGCGEVQESADAYLAGGWHGAFTYAFDKIWKPTMTRSAMSRALKAWMIQNGYPQIPRVLCTTELALGKCGE